MTGNSQNQMYGLKINFLSITFADHIISPKDSIRVAIYSVPDHFKQSFVSKYEDINSSHCFLLLNANSRTKKLVVGFTKVKKFSFSNNQAFGSTIINGKYFVQLNNESKIQNIDIFEPIDIDDMKNNNTTERKIIGQMKIQFEIKEPFIFLEDENQNHQIICENNIFRPRKIIIPPKVNNNDEYCLLDDVDATNLDVLV